MTRRWHLHARHILESIEKVIRYKACDELKENTMQYDAIVRNLQTIAEATSRIPEEVRAKYPEIEWRLIKGMRNILVHEYLGEIDLEAIESVIKNDLPVLQKAVKDMLESAA